jgi:hypothetical protein
MPNAGIIIEGEVSMRYLLGDSTESKLEINYLTFLREVVDCAVVLMEAQSVLVANVDKRNARASEWAGLIRAVEELGNEAAALVEPIAQEQAKTPAGRCASAIAKAVKDAVEAETAQAKASLAAARDEVDRDDQQVRARARANLEKLVRSHDLPGAEKELEAQWSGSAVKAKMRQRTGFGVEAVIALETSSSSLLSSDLRVERIAEGVEVHVREAGGWLKKGDKLVAQKLGRYQVIGVTVAAKQVAVQLRSAPDANAATLAITVRRSGEVTIASRDTRPASSTAAGGAVTIASRDTRPASSTAAGGAVTNDGGGGKEYEVDERGRNGLKQLADRLEASLRELEDQRVGLLDISIDNMAFAEHAQPRVLAERLVTEIAPTVQLIARHSRSPGELVLRRQLADDRREEYFISVSELVRKIETLPVPARSVFAPLQLGSDPNTGPVRAHAQPAEPALEPKVVVEPQAAAEPRAAESAAPAVGGEPRRSSPSVSPPSILAASAARTGRTIPPPASKSEMTPQEVADAQLAASIDAALADDEPA